MRNFVIAKGIGGLQGMRHDSFVDWMTGRRDLSGTQIKPSTMRGM